MKTVQVAIPYGETTIGAAVPRDRFLGIVRNRRVPHVDSARLLHRVLRKERIAKDARRLFGGKRIIVVVPDNTRKAHLAAILPPVLELIGKHAARLTIIVGTGLHKKHTRAELARLLGEKVVGRWTVASHEQRAGMLVRRGRTPTKRVPVVLHKAVAACDGIVTFGVVEPHLYAGYSGGVKTVAIGLAGEETISATHSVRFLGDPATKIGETRRNPFQKTLQEIVRGLPILLAINVVNDPDGDPVAIFAGRVDEVFRRSVAFARGVFEVSVDRPADIVICGVGYPKDANLYQASRAINYILNVERPILRKGGVLIVVAELRNGAGEGVSEKRFLAALRSMRSPREFLRKTEREGCVAGDHRAYMVARPLIDHHVILVTRCRGSFLEKTPLSHCSSIEAALARADDLVGREGRIAVVPHALAAIAQLRKGRSSAAP